MHARKAAKLALRQREPNGRQQRPTTRVQRAEGIMAVALAHPHRKGDHSTVAGYVVGRLFKAGRISEAQLHAANKFGLLAVSYMRDVTGSLPRLPSMMAERVASETGGGAEQDPERIANMRAQWQGCQNALADKGLFTAQGVLVKAVVLDHELSPAEEAIFTVAVDCLRAHWKDA